ncbi:MAG: M67 family metallopeptidase [Chloroflexi bacterium]|nr:M67 family metallopeptidase [Chloroflexota bacterium]
MIIHISHDLQREISEQLEATYPNEGGGFLLGRGEADQVQIVDIIQVDNVFDEAEQHHRYAMRPQDWMRLEDMADERGLSLVGYYHSHPDSPALPSEYDREHALPNFVYIITAVMMAQASDMRAWQLRPDRSAFDELKIAARRSLTE